MIFALRRRYLALVAAAEYLNAVHARRANADDHDHGHDHDAAPAN